MIIYHRKRFRFFDSSPVVARSEKQLALIASFNARSQATGNFFEKVPCLCGCQVFDVLAANDGQGLFQQSVICQKCGLVQSNPRMTEENTREFYESDRYRDIYSSEASEDLQFEWSHSEGTGLTEHNYQIINGFRSITSDLNILEFGAFSGTNLLPFMRHGAKCTGIDLSKIGVDTGPKHGVNMIHGGLEEVEGKYDIIILSHVLEHLLHPISVLEKLKEHLVDTGIFYIAVPNIQVFHMGQIQNSHTYYFCPESLAYFVSLAGLELKQAGVQGDIHQYGIFQPGNSSPNEELLSLSKKSGYRTIYRFIAINMLKNFARRIGVFSYLKRLKKSMSPRVL